MIFYLNLQISIQFLNFIIKLMILKITLDYDIDGLSCKIK